ncbi:MAG: type I DNA topoisomerase, partial [Paludibacteraceae bacterium]|nr:type I DNA topoisomerase [Paludibacteraceae bacterium]
MPENLVIVESPAKAKTIQNFLGKDFTVMSSFGHIRDLSDKGLGIDFDHNYEPLYEVSKDKLKLVGELKKASKSAKTVWLASDEDREGEAISWHLAEVLGLDKAKSKRIVFHEITKNAILKAIETPREIDINLVDAQQARRVLDRIVGYELSPVLWRKIKPSLSAGRVQSVAVRLIVEREREINNFKSEASYRVLGEFTIANAKGKASKVKAELQSRFKTKEEVLMFLENCKNADFSIDNVVVKPAKKSPAPPFTTSTLQQEAARKLGFSVNQTMRVAQTLYESGHITYMRTDSLNLSTLAIGTAKETITENYGEKYSKTRQFHTSSKGAQEAHEAIRPTYIAQQAISGTAQEKRLYDLIWKRTVASQMADAEIERTTATIKISTSDEKFVATGEVVTFDGFLKLYLESTDDETAKEDSSILPPLKKGDALKMNGINATERFSQHPARYTEASLVRKLEELGIGRPSTYAPIISTIQNRGYVEKGEEEGVKRLYNVLSLGKDNAIVDEMKEEITGAEKGKLLPTDTGIVVTDFLDQTFPNIMDYNFTAKVEKDFDNIAEGKTDWKKSIDKFYKDFHPSVEASMVKSEHKIGERILGEEPGTGKPVSVKIGRFGPVAQIGSADEEEKPRFAPLRKGQSIETITLDEVLDLFKLPRTLGQFEDKDIVAAVGRFGPYIRHNSKFVSIPKGEDPLTITLERAIELIEKKRTDDKNKIIKTFDEEPEL